MTADSNDSTNENFLKASGFGLVTGEPPCQTMSSREIADLTGKEHDNVRRDIKNMADALSLTFEEKSEPSSGGRPSRVYLLPKRETLILVSGYNLTMRAKIIDRWQQLETEASSSAATLHALNDPATLRTLLLENVEERLRLVTQLAAAAPKLDAFDRIAGSEGSLCITDAAKSLQVRPKDLFEFLRSHGWIYSPPGGRGDIAYSTSLQRGLMEHKTTTVHRSDGSEKIITQARVTPKGLARLAQEFPPPAVAA